MASKLYEETNVQEIAEAIREKNKTNNRYKIAEMAAAVRNITTGPEVNVYSWNQIPTLVKNYLDNVTYNPSDYTVSSVGDYAPATADVNNTYPIGVSINVLDGITDRNGYEMNVSEGTVTLVNDIPNQYTEYVVRNNGVVSQVGTLRPTGFLRQIKCTTFNVRDLGGWSCDGGSIKYGKIFRGGEFATVDLDIFLNQLGIRHELNLRGATEGNNSVTILRNYVGFTCPDNYPWYNISDSATWREILRCIFDCVAENKPIFFHCSAGADRTGTVACIVEAILGVSQSDIDKDYELTSFATGTSTDTQVRRRNENEWCGLITAINSLTVGNSFRDKVLYWVASLGFTVDEINAFRNAMINGTPDSITLDIETYSISKTGVNMTFDNDATTIKEYQSYTLNIIPENGYLIDSITVTMGGVDITDQVFTGSFRPNGTLTITENGKYETGGYEKVNVNVSGGGTGRTVTKTLNNSTSNNTQTVVTDGQSYGAVITSNNGYEISSITVKMGGTDITSSVVILI